MAAERAQVTDRDVRRHNESVLSRCEEGDLLEFPRGKSYSHWGVYAGKGRVIHRTGDKANGSRKKEKAEIKEDSFWDVVGDSLAKINNYLDKNRVALSGREIVRRARQKVGETGYNLLWKNCEHFATWCRYGEEFSEQVWNAVTNFVYAAGAIVGIILAVIFRTRRMQ